MYTPVRSIAAALFAATAFPIAAHAADEPVTAGIATLVAAGAVQSTRAACADESALTPLQRRVLAKYDEGTRTLMEFVWITQSVHHLDATQAGTWAEQYRRTHPKC